MSNITVGELLIETLVLAGVKRIYGVPGDSLNGITDAIRKNSNIEWSHFRNEEAAAFAAGAEAQLTGKLAVCAGSCGPGNLHLINGLYDAHRNRVPVLAIAAHIPTSEIGSNYFQETHPEVLYRECSHYVELISNVNHMPRVLERAMQTAIARQGVVVVVIPGDISAHEASTSDPIPVSTPSPVIAPSSDELDMMASLLNSGGKVTIFGGAGCAGAHSELLAVAARLRAPIVHTVRGKEFIEYDNPYDVGLTGLLGFESGANALMHADVLLMLGTDFPYRPFFPENATVIQVDIRGEQLGRRVKVDLGVVGDVKTTLALLLPKLAESDDGAHLDKWVHHYKDTRKLLDELATPGKEDRVIHSQYLARMTDELATDDAIFTCDVGTPTVWAARYLKMNGKRRLLGSFNHGSMANALAQALGAQSAFPKRQVVALVGDGGLAMLLGDLLTLRQMNLPVKIVVFQNNALSFVELEMKSAGVISFGTDLITPDFSKMAEAAGLAGFRAETPEQVRPMLEQAFAHDGPALVEVLVNRQDLAIPPTITGAEIRGFSLYLIRAVLNGRGDELLHVASSNTLREVLGVVRETLLG
jgi:pyruvate dehydrogenase (quinone)